MIPWAIVPSYRGLDTAMPTVYWVDWFRMRLGVVDGVPDTEGKRTTLPEVVVEPVELTTHRFPSASTSTSKGL